MAAIRYGDAGHALNNWNSLHGSYWWDSADCDKVHPAICNLGFSLKMVNSGPFESKIPHIRHSVVTNLT